MAGASGLERLVAWLNVMEVPDVLAWVKPNELLLTTGFPLVRLPDQVAFDDILKEVYAELKSFQAAVLEQIDALHAALTMIVLEGGDLDPPRPTSASGPRAARPRAAPVARDEVRRCR